MTSSSANETHIALQTPSANEIDSVSQHIPLVKNVENMKVVFVNTWNVGDIFFSQPFIKNIVTNNPENDYYIYHRSSSYYFTDILEPNIKDIKNIPKFTPLKI